MKPTLVRRTSVREQRPHEWTDGRSRPHGRSTVEIKCPYCDTWTTCYKWSLAGSGKRCHKCRAVHHWMNHVTTRLALGEEPVNP